MVRVTGKVINSEMSTITVYDKDKDGNRLSTYRNVDVCTLGLLCHDDIDKQTYIVVCKKFDVPPTFVYPKVGDTYTTPTVRRLETSNGIVICNI